MTDPDVSFVIASYNARAFLADAVRSALGQRGVAVEVLVIDDGSSDDSRAVAETMAASDPRVRPFRTPQNLGPGGARNIGLAEARGTWIAVLDSDDLLHPDRSRRLIGAAIAAGADMVADDLLLFDDARVAPPSLFLSARRATAAGWIDLPGYLDETRMFGRAPNLGFLKPMIRADRLRDIRYDESLRIAEDDALVIALLRAGARYWLEPQPLYFYRKHGASISHRLSGANVDRMRAAGDRLRDELEADPTHARALAPRDRALTRAWAFTHLIEALKARRIGQAIGLLARHPSILPMLSGPIRGAAGRIASRFRKPPSAAPIARDVALFISRQRLIGATNGSSTYLLAIAQAARDAGRVPHLLQPSPVVFGRTPFYRLLPEMAVFDRITVAGAVRIGDRLITRDPSIWLAAAQGALASILRRIGVRHAIARDRKLPPSISRPWQREDLLAIARHGQMQPGVAIADYIFQGEALPYLIAPHARTAIVMHDLFHARAGQFAPGDDSVALLDAKREIAMLGAADAVLAIQAEEARFVVDNVPDTRAILVPMPALCVDRAQPGDASQLLFVGSNTAPNVLGLQWFFDDVWPIVQTARSDIRLDIAGTVSRGFGTAPDGARFLGLVDDLAACYATAGTVISPLLQGSGLKIKLIEAIAHGKASVVTGVTLQGVEDLGDTAVIRADTASDFAAAIVRLADDDAFRAALAERALTVARDRFGPATSMAAFTDWLTETA